MKRIISIALGVSLVQFAVGTASAQVVSNPALARRLDSLGREDQKWRNLIGAIERGQTDTISREAVMRNWVVADSLNQIEAKKIFAQHGFPGYDAVGEKGSLNFFLLVQHSDSDPAFQEQVLKALKQQADRKNADPKQYAYLLDRVRVNKGEKQVYGTQLRPKKGVEGIELAPVVEPEKLDQRRAAVGLPPVAEYLKTVGAK
jgi:hypothetical protein